MKPSISIIIPLYNKEDSIISSLDSLLSQSLQNYEIIVVDDGSTDLSVSKLNSWNGKVRFISQKNKGPSSARNLGASYAKSDLLSFLDADDRLCPDFISTHLFVREKDPSINFSINSFEVYEDNSLIKSEHLFDRAPYIKNTGSYNILPKFDYRFTEYIHSSGFCIDKDLFFQSGGFNESMRCWEISEAITRFSLKARRIAVLGDVLSQVYTSSNSLFKAEKGTIEYREIYCAQILKLMVQIPDESKSRYFRTIEDLCYTYLRLMEYKKMSNLYLKAKQIEGAKLYFSPSRKVRIVSEFIKYITS
jgi:glycosyltransferase involved in cell wall biosynthesis